MLTAILPGVVYTIITWQSSTNALANSIGISFKDSASATAHHITDSIEGVIADAEILSKELVREVSEGDLNLNSGRIAGRGSSTNGISQNDDLNKALAFFTAPRKKHYSRFLVTDQNGQVISASPSKNARQSLAEEPWWRQALKRKNGQVFVGNLHHDAGIDRHVLDVAIPIRSLGANGESSQKGEGKPKAQGVFVMEITLDKIFEDLADRKIGEDSHIDVFDSQGNLILDKARFMHETMSDDLTENLASAKPTWKVTNDEHDRLALMGVAPVEFEKKFVSDVFTKDNLWYVMIPMPLLEAYGPVIGLMQKLFILGWLAVLVIMMGGYYGSRQIIQPLRKLKAGAHEIGNGNLDHRVDIKSGDETQDLAEEFNDMAVALKASQQRLRAANDQLRQASRLKSDFLANMSHELRTPLNSIIGFAEVLADQLFGPLNTKQQKYTDNIYTSGHHLLQLINDILDLSKIEAGKLELRYDEFVVRNVLQETISSVKMLAVKKDLNLDLQVTRDLVTIAADEAKFKQIMYNLLSNAVKFTPENGHISIKAVRERNTAVISVRDTGIGISKKDQELIFEQFRQVSSSDAREFEGTGLGLTLTRQLVELHGGRISIESELGQGSVFTFSMPIAMPKDLVEQEDVSQIERLPELAGPAKTGPVEPKYFAEAEPGDKESTEKPVILIIEDDPKAAELLSIYLREADYDVVVTADADEGLKLAHDIQPFAITLDIMLPDKDGWQALEELKSSAATKNIPVVICSMVDDRQLGLSMGAAGHITKPVDRDVLLQALGKCRSMHEADKPYVVLVVDDDPNAVELVTAILEPEGLGVLKAYGGAEAIELALDRQPDLMILDLMMPKVTGFDVIQSLNESEAGKRIPIIVLTAKDLTTEDTRILNRHIDRIMQKATFKKDDLLREVQKLENLHPDRAMLIDRETGLYNYRYFKKRLREEEHRAIRYRRDFSIILARISNLDQVKHRSPETNRLSVVRDIAQLLEQNIRGADPIARYSNNHFAIILPETTESGGRKAAKKITTILEGYQALSRSTSELTRLDVSINTISYFEHEADGQSVMDRLEAGLDEPTMSKH